MLAVSLTGMWLIDGKTKRLGQQVELLTEQSDKLEQQSTRVENSLNKGVGDLTDASDGLIATINNARDVLKKFKGHQSPPTQPRTDDEELADDGNDYWDNVSECWRDVKVGIERKIEMLHSTDPRRFRKYAEMTRYNYEPIVEKLINDGHLDAEAGEAFVVMKIIYDFYRPQKYSVSLDDWDKFQEYLVTFQKHIDAE